MTYENLLKEINAAAPGMYGLNIKKVGEVMEIFQKVAVNLFREGEEIRLPKLGKFKVCDYPERKARNPKTGERVTVAARRRVRFISNGTLKERLNHGQAD